MKIQNTSSVLKNSHFSVLYHTNIQHYNITCIVYTYCNTRENITFFNILYHNIRRRILYIIIIII